MRVQARPRRRPAERDLAEPPERPCDTVAAFAHLRRVAGELLAERDRYGIHQMRAAGLDDVVELHGLRLERRRESLERRQKVVRDLVERREVHGRREDVVRRLTHVHVVVRVHVVTGECCDHLVRVHVRRRSGPSLEHVDRELVVELARCNPVAAGAHALRLLVVEQPELRVDTRSGRLDAAEPPRNGGRNRLPRDREGRDRLTRFVAPKLAALLRLGHAIEFTCGMRARDLGVVIGGLEAGAHDAITDVEGVRVGHATVVAGDTVRTGVTVVVPPETPLFAGCHRLNGNGELTGLEWVRESGMLTTPVGITNTFSVGVVRDALAAASVDDDAWALPVVGETYDGFLNDIRAQRVTAAHVDAAFESASADVAEGNVGGGTGMVCHELKGGIGTASRTVNGHVVGVLVQANYGRRGRFRVDG